MLSLMKTCWALLLPVLWGCPGQDTSKANASASAAATATAGSPASVASKAELPTTDALPLPAGDPLFRHSYEGSYEAYDAPGALLCKIEVKNDEVRMELVDEAGKAQVVLGTKRGGSRRYTHATDGRAGKAMLRKVKRHGRSFRLLGPTATSAPVSVAISSHAVAVVIGVGGSSQRQQPPILFRRSAQRFVRFRKQNQGMVVYESLQATNGKLELRRGADVLARAQEKGDKLHWFALALPGLSLQDRCIVAAELAARGL